MGKATVATVSSASVSLAKRGAPPASESRPGGGATGSSFRRKEGVALHLALALALLLFLTPALASAWTLRVVVSGPAGVPGNNVAVSGGATRTVTSGTVVLYPVSAATVTVNTAAGYSKAVTVDGMASGQSSFTFSSGSHTVSVSYAAPAGNNVAITQGSGGTVSIQLPNNTWSTTGATGVAPGTSLPVSIAANGGYVIREYTINGSSTQYNGTLPGEVLSLPFTVTATPVPNSITAGFALAPTVSATLHAPLDGYTAQSISCSADATSNDTGLDYYFSVVSKPAGAAEIPPLGPGAAKSFSFVPDLIGNYRVQVTVRSSHGGFGTAYADVAVTSYLDYQNSRCTSCHATSFPAAVNAYNAGSHRSRGVSCEDCHSSDAAHENGINSDNVSPLTFTVTGVVAGRSAGSLFCMTAGCHLPGTTHKSPGILCAACHNSGEPHNPDTSFASSASVCFGCHGGANTTHFLTKESLSPSECAACHRASGHDPAPPPAVSRAHFNGYSSCANPKYAAAYVTPATACADCHQGGDPASAADAALREYRVQWGASGHGDLNGSAFVNSPLHNWKGSGTSPANAKASAGIVTDCQRCHTPQGYLRFARYTSISPVGTLSARYSEPLACNACHESGAFEAVRVIAPRTGYYNYSSALTGRLSVARPLPDSGKSNLCLGCHVGREAGATIKAMAQATALKSYSSSFWRDTGFVNAHYLSAGGQLFGVTGYEYPGVEYRNGSADHTGVGAGDGRGPCVACHMPGASHTLEASAGGYALCNGCHAGSGVVDGAFLAARKEEFDAALKALAAALSSRGFAPTLDGQGGLQYPYFSARNWGNGESAPGNMGAAFNFNLLSHDPGAFAHNPTYVKRLLRDSIDYLTLGGVDRSRDLSATMEGLLPDRSERERAAGFFADAGSGNAACGVCHGAALDPASGEGILASYRASKHASAPGGAGCSNCHAPTPATAHPHGAMLSTPSEISGKCLGCHPAHSWPSAGRCMECHNAHNPGAMHLGYPHYANFSTAQYVTARVSCDNCHGTVDILGDKSFNIYPANLEWSASAKGDILSPSWTSNDFKTLGSPLPATPANSAGADCVRCHTTTGYINYVSSNFQDISPWGTPGGLPGGDRTREMVACSACHSPTPFLSYYQYDWENDVDTPPFSRRSVPQVTVYYNFSSAGAPRILNPVLIPYNAGSSNNCIVCHSGKVAGSTLKALGARVSATDPFWNGTPFIDPHGMAAAGILYGKGGYQFGGRSYSGPANFVHRALGEEETGPCISCHMTTPKPHLFTPVSSASNGVIGKITAFKGICSGCHSGGVLDLNAASLEKDRERFVSSLRALAATLATLGIRFDPERAPYFFDALQEGEKGGEIAYRRWGERYLAGATPLYRPVDLMGAAFNLRLLWSERGAYTHNDFYTKRLIYDAIDLADDGKLNGEVFVTLQGLGSSPDFTETDRMNAKEYVGTRP